MLLKLLLIAMTVQNASSQQSCITGQTWSKTGIGPCTPCTANCPTTAPFVVQQCTATSDTYCSVCPYADQFSSNGLLANCKKCTTPCDNAKSYETTSCGATAGQMDRVCTACTPAKCSANAKMTTPCGGTTGTANIMCACIAGLTWSNTGNEGAAANLKCLKCKACTAKQFTAKPCTAKTNTVCKACDKSCATCKAAGPKACTSCTPPLQLQKGSCAGCEDAKTWSASGVAPCKNCTTCSANQYVSMACKVTANTVCNACDAPCSTCSGPGQNACKACTAPAVLQSDNSCKIRTACVKGTTWSTTGYESCTRCKTCPAGQTVKQPCTAKNDTTCACPLGCVKCTSVVPQKCTTCNSNFFLSKDTCLACNTACATCSGAGAKKCNTCANTYSKQKDGSCKKIIGGCPTWTSMGLGLTVNNRNNPTLAPLPLPGTLKACQDKCISVPTCVAIAFRQQSPVSYCYLHTKLSWPGKKVNPVIAFITEYAVKRC